MQTCGHADADGCKPKRKKEKGKKNRPVGSEHVDGRVDVWTCGRVGVWACSHAGMRMRMWIAVNKRNKK